MKRIDQTWWKDATGYYKQISKGIFEGPFDTMQDLQEEEDNWTYSLEDDDQDSTVVDSGTVRVYPSNK